VTVLLVESDRAIVAALWRGLTNAGFMCEVVATAKAATDRLATGDVLAVVLDLDTAELGVVDFMRVRRLLAPIVALGPADTATCINALDRGADGYVRKPFESDEVVARVRAAVRRCAWPRWAGLSCNRVRLWPDQLVEIGTERVKLSPTEHDILGLLLRRQGEPVDRSTIQEHVRRLSSTRSEAVTMHISSLRTKLGDSFVEIECVRSMGYRLRPVKPHDVRRGNERRRSSAR
jgi:DNA-binding response OmpR family regulator